MARGRDLGTRGAGRPLAGLFARYPWRQAQRKKARRVERCRESERVASPPRWSEAMWERTANVSMPLSGVFPASWWANSFSQNEAKRSRWLLYARTGGG